MNNIQIYKFFKFTPSYLKDNVVASIKHWLSKSKFFSFPQLIAPVKDRIPFSVHSSLLLRCNLGLSAINFEISINWSL
ncbi:MAG TPA: hypothetical protein P5241_02545 [Candidatus Paceibacterota bacterium]|nr:hypothetical protein [Candidatus Paceibacterota bacterium]